MDQSPKSAKEHDLGGVHAIFADDAYSKLEHKSYEVITCNSISHVSNKIDLSSILGKEIQKQLGI